MSGGGTMTDEPISKVLPSGKYWIGDPCYAFEDHGVWMALLESADYTGPQRILEAEAGGEKFVASGTAFGDGVYLDGDGNRYGVDAGLLGAVPARPNEKCPSGMREVEFTEAFTVEYDDGTVRIGPIAIETDPKFYCDNYWCQTEIEEWQDYCDSCAEEEEDDE